jgi:general secretion pathway protein L
MTTIRFDPKAPISWQGAVLAARGFLAWWWGQLRALLPDGLARRLSAWASRPTLTLGESEWRLHASDILALDPSEPDAELHERIARFAPTCFAERIDVVIPAASGFARTLRLPEAASSRLRSVVALQIGRLSPFRAEHVSFGYRRVGEARNGEMEVEVWLVPNQALQDYEQRLGRIGLSVRRFLLDEISFAPLVTRRTSNERLQYVLAAVAVASVAAAVMLTPAMRASELRALTAQVAALSKPAHEAVSLRAELGRLAAPVRAASTELAKPGALAVLRNVTELLPDDAVLTELDVEGTRVRIAGTCRDARRLVSLLSRSGRFSDVGFAAPSGRAPDGRDLFQIAMTVAR